MNAPTIHTLSKDIIGDDITKPILIQDIQSKQARNLIRGISERDNYSVTVKSLQKIKNTCSFSDYKKSVLYIRTDRTFTGNPIGELFNTACPKSLSEAVSFSLDEIMSQINSNSKELIELSRIAAETLNLSSNNLLSEALGKCFELIKNKGTSIFLIRAISFITIRIQFYDLDDKTLLEKIEKIKDEILLSRVKIIEDTMSQLSNLRTSHLATYKKINEIESNHPHIHISKALIKPIPENMDDFLLKLNGYFSFSLFDAFLYVALTKSMNLPFIAFNKPLSKDLDIAFNEIQNIDFLPEKMYKEITEDSGYHYLRESFLFIETPQAFKFNTIHGHYYSDGKNRSLSCLYTKKLIDNYFSDVKKLSDLRHSKMDVLKVNREQYDKNNCGMLENSCALIHFLRKTDGDVSRDDELLFVKLMSFTRDIGEICLPEHLERIAKSAEDKFLKLVIRCLISINNKKKYAEYELRSSIQECCSEYFDGDLNLLLECLFKLSPAVTEHLLLICNETFLITLFHLIEKPVDALEMRAKMLQWFGEETNSERYLDRARMLRIDIQINKERDTIDDSRIYVDSFKYTQWFEDNMVSKLTMALDNLILNKRIKFNFDWERKSNSISPPDIVIEHLLSCYKIFCDNSIFGIASYLGRRIRHGTFEGTALTELSELPTKSEYEALFEDRDFKTNFETWFKNYRDMIKNLVNESLQIKTRKKTKGLITTDIDTPQKITHGNQLVYDILSTYSSRSGVIQLPGLIIEHCWRLVECDLRETRKFLSEMKSTHAVFSYSPPPHTSTNHKRRIYSKFAREVNLVVSKKFSLMSSWFNKPSYASPSTDIYLLFRAVISEVKGNVSHFDPIYSIDEKSFQIAGGTYYVIYDALSVLIYNAAIHGKQRGKIKFDVQAAQGRNALRITLSSELKSEVPSKQTKMKIEAAIADADENAHVVEGNSGIKKLKKLEQDGSISDVSYSIDREQHLLQFEFYFELLSRGKYENTDC